MDKDLAFYYGSALILLYFVVGFISQILKRNNLKKKIKFAEAEYETAKNNCITAKNILSKSITKTYGPEKAAKFQQGNLWRGMHRHLLVISRGRANNIKRTVHNTVVTEKWQYGKNLNILGQGNDIFEVTLEDNIVMDWHGFK